MIPIFDLPFFKCLLASSHTAPPCGSRLGGASNQDSKKSAMSAKDQKETSPPRRHPMRLHYLMALFLFFGSTLPAAAQRMQDNTDRPGSDFKGVYVNDPFLCRDECRRNQRECRAWTFVKRDHHCMLKTTAQNARADACCVSGVEPKPSPSERHCIEGVDPKTGMCR